MTVNLGPGRRQEEGNATSITPEMYRDTGSDSSGSGGTWEAAKIQQFCMTARGDPLWSERLRGLLVMNAF